MKRSSVISVFTCFGLFCWLGCGQTPPAETPSRPSDHEPSASTQPDTTEVTPPPAPTVKMSEDKDPNAARELLRADCRTLGGKYGEVLRSDETAKFSPNLSADQRATVKRAMEESTGKLQARYEEACSTQLVGKYVSEAALQCAMGAKTVAEFDTCINGPSQ